MQEITNWLENFCRLLQASFGEQLLFIGLQGSYGRGEAGPDSDIDVVVIFRRLDAQLLEQYRLLTAALPKREKLCGFVGGCDELRSWVKSDLFQLYYDTKPLYGSLDFLRPLAGREEARALIHSGSCNLYHACCHNYLHARSAEALTALYKGAVFVAQAKHYFNSGGYVKKHGELVRVVADEDKFILENAQRLKKQNLFSEDAFAELSTQLLAWSRANILRYGGAEGQP